MKFLCEHCKAKYQIADDKVAGRTVRMKCRKCGGAIEVRAGLTDTGGGDSPSPSEAPEPMKAEAPKGVPPKRPPPPKPAPSATSLSQPARNAPASTSAKPAAGNESPLAGAFQRNVQREEDTTASGLDLRELSAADEWYVAVNGVPVGPVRVAEVRRKAAMGAVTEESLCWQEGMEEWRAVKTVTELAAVVREAASGGRISQVPSEPRASRPPPPPRAAPPRLAPAPKPAPPTAAAKKRPVYQDEVATVVGHTPFSELEASAAAASHPNDLRIPTADPFKPAAGDPFSRQAPSHSSNQPQNPFGAAQPTANGSPFTHAAPPQAAIAAPAASPFASAPPASLPAPIVVAAPRRFSPIAAGVVVMFGCFGLASAYFMFTKPDRPIVVNIPPAPSVTPPTPQTAAPSTADIPPPVAPTATAAAAAVDAGGVKVASATPHATGGATGASTSGAPKAGPGNVTDPALRDLINGTGNGPSATPGGGGGGGGGAQLTEDEIKQVVAAHSLGVRRTCWDRTTSTTPSVNVTVHIIAAGSGQVTQASATGNDLIVGHCLEEEIRRWHLPGGGEFNVPFHFLRQ